MSRKEEKERTDTARSKPSGFFFLLLPLLREGTTKRELARLLKTDKDVIRSWLSGEAIGRKASVDRIKEFLAVMGDIISAPGALEAPSRRCQRSHT